MFKKFKFIFLIGLVMLTGCSVDKAPEQVTLRDENGCLYEVVEVEEVDLSFCLTDGSIEFEETENEFDKIILNGEFVGYYLRGDLQSDFYDQDGLEYTLKYLELVDGALPIKDQASGNFSLYGTLGYTVLNVSAREGFETGYGTEGDEWVMLKDAVFRFESKDNLKKFLITVEG